MSHLTDYKKNVLMAELQVRLQMRRELLFAALTPWRRCKPVGQSFRKPQSFLVKLGYRAKAALCALLGRVVDNPKSDKPIVAVVPVCQTFEYAPEGAIVYYRYLGVGPGILSGWYIRNTYVGYVPECSPYSPGLKEKA